jgi:hypothetical protein
MTYKNYNNINYNILLAFSIRDIAFGIATGLFCGCGDRNLNKKRKSSIVHYRIGCTDLLLYKLNNL